MDLMQLRRWRRASAIRSATIEFKHLWGSMDGKFISGDPCTCGGNHYSVIIKNDGEHVWCPVSLWLNCVRVKIMMLGTKKGIGWGLEHPIGPILKKIDPDKDATLREELIWTLPSTQQCSPKLSEKPA